MSTTVPRTDSSASDALTSGEHSGPLEIIVTVAERGIHGPNPHEIQFQAIKSTLERIGTVQRLKHPESRLAFAAHRAAQRGKRPIHLAFGPPHEVYLTPTVPTAVVTLWGFPDVPSTDVSRNTKQNWTRIVSCADAVFVLSEATAHAFRSAGVSTPLIVLATPIPDEFSKLANWSDQEHAFSCRHCSWGGPPISSKLAEQGGQAEPTISIETPVVKRPLPIRAKRLAARTVKRGYDQLVRRWLSQEAHERLKGLKRALLRQTHVQPAPAPPGPPLPVFSELRLGGLTFLAEVDYSDPGVNDLDLLSSFLIAYRRQPRATLVVCLHTTADREAHDFWRICHHYEMLKISHECRLVVVSQSLEPEDRATLMSAANYVVDTRRTAREAWLVSGALAAGRPVIGPNHSALGDWINDRVGFVVRSSDEPAAWPQHPEGRRESLAHRLDWSELRERFYRAGMLSTGQYRNLAENARSLASDRLSPSHVEQTWREAIETLSHCEHRSLEWAG